jgi:hypothetical protein
LDATRILTPSFARGCEERRQFEERRQLQEANSSELKMRTEVSAEEVKLHVDLRFTFILLLWP